MEVLDPFAVVVRAELEVDPARVSPDLLLRLHACLDQVIRRAGAEDNGRGLRSGALIQALPIGGENFFRVAGEIPHGAIDLCDPDP
jgi:hypothetical protein